MGREGNHDVIIPDLVCSKFHLKFDYDIKQQFYTCIDLGSRNGTILNGQRMSNSKQESEAIKLDHGSVSLMKFLLFLFSSCGFGTNKQIVLFQIVDYSNWTDQASLSCS